MTAVQCVVGTTIVPFIFFIFNAQSLLDFLCIVINIFFVVGSWMQQGTINLVEQEIKITCLRPAEDEQIRALMASLDQDTRASMKINRVRIRISLIPLIQPRNS
jgi:hypothetical protein